MLSMKTTLILSILGELLLFLLLFIITVEVLNSIPKTDFYHFIANYLDFPRRRLPYEIDGDAHGVA